MADYLRQAIELFEARPLTCVGVAVAAIWYLNLMLSDPRIR